MTETKTLVCSDGFALFYRVWLPDGVKPVAAVHILHGMAEHSERYDRFARFLNDNAIAVYAQDHRGHGYTAGDGTLGWFAEKDGWMRVAEDAYELSLKISHNHKKIPLFIFGHSMGSFLLRTVITKHPELYQAAIICGTGAGQGIKGKAGKLFAKQLIKNQGAKTPSPLMTNLSFGAYNKAFEPTKTSSDWLSRDEAEVQKYLDDEYCGFICSAQFFHNLLEGIAYANSKKQAKRIPRDLPMLIISGEQDPVGNFGKGLRKVYKQYRGVGISDITLKLYPGARHELLNEINREEVQQDVLSWIESHIDEITQ